jgi:type IV secretory pathway VirB10-like protein
MVVMAKKDKDAPNGNEKDNIPYVGIRKEVAVVGIILLLIVFLIIYFVSTIRWGSKKNIQSQKTKIIKNQVNRMYTKQSKETTQSIISSLVKQPKPKINKMSNKKKKMLVAESFKASGKVPGIPVKKAFNPNSANNSQIEVISPPSVISNIKKSITGQPNSDLAFQSELLKQLQTRMPQGKKSENQKHISFLNNAKKAVTPAVWLSPYAKYNLGTQYFIAPGSIIPATLETGVNSQLPGQVVAIVNQDVYSHNLDYLLIPKGSELIGQYDTSVGATQTRVLLAFSLVIFPDGSEMQLPGFEGASHRGYAGLHDVVDYHFWSTAKSVSLLTLLDFGIQEAAGNTTGNVYPTPAQQFATSLSQNLGNVAQQIVNEQISLAPTLKVKPGFTFDIVVTKNIIFRRAYR